MRPKMIDTRSFDESTPKDNLTGMDGAVTVLSEFDPKIYDIFLRPSVENFLFVRIHEVRQPFKLIRTKNTVQASSNFHSPTVEERPN